MNGGLGWWPILHAQAAVADLTLPLLYLTARRLGGPLAALPTLTVAALCPFVPLYDAAVLTESLATSLTVVTVAVLVLGARRPRLWMPVAGALVGLSTLLRPDGILLALGFVPALYALRVDKRARLRLAAAAAAAFAAVYLPWPVRNLVQLHRPYFLGQRVDRFTHPIPHYQGYWHWQRTWARDHDPQMWLSTCFLTPPCPNTSQTFPPYAFDSLAERSRVDALLALRAREGLTLSLSRGFDELAAERTRRAFFDVNVVLPLERSYHMWISPFDETLQNRGKLWPVITRDLSPYFERVMKLILLGLFSGSAGLLLRRETRLGALIVLAPIVTRSLVLPFSNYSMPRYTVEMLPLAYLIVCAGMMALVRRPREAWA
jgi:4-amino-4-deoxy-L-arabinose transferase-like glycosyltransferase